MSQWNKLKSRKLWSMIVGVFTIVVNRLADGPLTDTDILYLVIAIITYILSEAGVDVMRIRSSNAR